MKENDGKLQNYYTTYSQNAKCKMQKKKNKKNKKKKKKKKCTQTAVAFPGSLLKLSCVNALNNYFSYSWVT